MARTDEEIKKDVVERLSWDERVDAAPVQVEVESCVVTLRGEVDTYFAQRAAVETAFSVLGVSDVQPQLGVRPPAGTAVPSDEALRHQIEQALLWNANLHAADIRVSVAAGVVTLEGFVGTYWKKMHAEDVAAQFRGVVGIENKLTIVPTHDVEDRRVAETLEQELDRDPLVDAEDVNVRVNNGEVALTGRTTNWAGRRAAIDTARYTRGVREVRHAISVVPPT